MRSWTNASWLDAKPTGYVEAVGCTDSKERVTFEIRPRETWRAKRIAVVAVFQPSRPGYLVLYGAVGRGEDHERHEQGSESEAGADNGVTRIGRLAVLYAFEADPSGYEGNHCGGNGDGAADERHEASQRGDNPGDQGRDPGAIAVRRPGEMILGHGTPVAQWGE